MAAQASVLAKVLTNSEAELLKMWLAAQKGTVKGTTQDEAADLSRRLLSALQHAASAGKLDDIDAEMFADARHVLTDVSVKQALAGASPTDTATFVFSLKAPLFALLQQECGKDADRLSREVWTATVLIDRLGLYTAEVFQKSREDVIRRQQEELLELSTPVVRLWQGILALPLIGTLDSSRTQVVMESLLQEIVQQEAAIAIIDITGVPTVDTLVAQHLLKTVSAARLMGADCIISGIRPQIAQTMVHLGVELNVVSKANMADAFALALRRVNKKVVDRNGKAKEDVAEIQPAAEA
jgi:rsbT co-antagonist protein RsbR